MYFEGTIQTWAHKHTHRTVIVQATSEKKANEILEAKAKELLRLDVSAAEFTSGSRVTKPTCKSFIDHKLTVIAGVLYVKEYVDMRRFRD
jgi:hypothetical protein